jgi:hypothetical protein
MDLGFGSGFTVEAYLDDLTLFYRNIDA